MKIGKTLFSSTYEQIGDRYSIARGKARYGSMLMDSGDSERGVKLLGDAREAWAAIKYENGVQWIEELLAEKEIEASS
jgi:hypothetical protein